MATKIDLRQTNLRTALPMVGSASLATTDTILPSIDAELAKLFEDRNIQLADGGIITFNALGTSVSFANALFLHVNSRTSGGSPVVISLGSTTRTVSANGRMIYAVIDRIAGTAVVTDDAASLPAVTSANQEVFLIAKRIDSVDGLVRLYFRDGTVLNAGQASRLGSSGNGSGILVARLLDNTSTTLTTGSPVTIDGQLVANDDRVLFTALSLNNNKIYKATVSAGNVTAWTAESDFNGTTSPYDGAYLHISEGDLFQDNLTAFDGTEWYSPLNHKKDFTLLDNTTGGVTLSIPYALYKSVMIKYSIQRGTAVETGILLMSTNGTDVALGGPSAPVGDHGVTFSADLSGGNMNLKYDTTNTGTDAIMRRSVEIF